MIATRLKKEERGCRKNMSGRIFLLGGGREGRAFIVVHRWWCRKVRGESLRRDGSEKLKATQKESGIVLSYQDQPGE